MKRLNQRQREILEWIRDGAPDREWPDYTHRSTARLLQARGLVKVHGRGTSWSATITDVGLAYLTGGYETSASTRTMTGRSDRHGKREPVGNTGAIRASAVPRITGVELLDQLIGAGGALRFENVDVNVRAAYRRALAAIPRDQVPDGKRVVYRGRDRGDLLIELIDKPEGAQAPPQIPVPEVVNLELPVVRHLSRDSTRMDVSEATRDRALRLIQAIIEECDRRGYSARHRGDEPGIELLIRGEAIAVTISEEKEKITRVPEGELAHLKYNWQRAKPVTVTDWSGRLTITLHTGAWSEPRWADRKRWTLASRLPQLLSSAEELAAARIDSRERAERERRERRKLWEESLPKAQKAYVADLNRSRLGKQLQAHSYARDLRAYADAIVAHATELDQGDDRDAALEWAMWIRTEADRTDPALHVEHLRYLTPAEFPTWEVSKYMPKGMDAHRPPD